MDDLAVARDAGAGDDLVLEVQVHVAFVVEHELDQRLHVARVELARVLGLGVDGWFTKLLLVIAIIFGTINVVGGFLVTDRMLEMFKSKPAPREEVEEGEG